MIGWVVLALYLGFYLGGVLALWTVSRAFGLPFRWRAALAWPAAYGEQADRFEAELKARKHRDGKA